VAAGAVSHRTRDFKRAASMIDAAHFSFVSALTALVASIAGPFVTLYVARTQIRFTVRSTNRQRWCRTSISEAVS
jgi:hypothetical protein